MIKLDSEKMRKMFDATGYDVIKTLPVKEYIKQECKGLTGFCKEFDYDYHNFNKRKGERIYLELNGRRVIALIERELHGE